MTTEARIRGHERDPKLIIVTPVRSAELLAADVKFGYARALLQVSRDLPWVAVMPYNTDVVRGRNRAVAKILSDHPTATHALHWDDDCWPEDIGVIPRMMALGVDVVGAAYTNKMQPLRWVHWRHPEEEVDERGLLRVRGVGMGFTLTSVRCLRRLSTLARQYTDYPAKTRCADVFGMLYDVGEDPEDRDSDSLLSEDFSFCKRWSDLGEPLYVWNQAIIHHAGQHAWSAKEMVNGTVRQAP